MEFRHRPVLVNEVLEYLAPKGTLSGSPTRDGVFVDGTLGGGGHALAVASKFKSQNLKFKIIGIDRDLEAIFAAKKNLAEFATKIEFVHDNFSNLAKILLLKGIEKVDGILLDLGVSSYQLNNSKRGFTFQNDSPLDMRMNQEDKESATDIINHYSESDLADIFYEYGGERNSRKIAKNITETRKNDKIATTGQLSGIIENSFPPNYKFKYKIHPATRVFQALRIETNNELNILSQFIPEAAKLLAGDGRLLIISFHSGEDKIVKHAFRELEEKNNGKYKVLTKKPITAGEDEIRSNSRSRSAKLRVIAKSEL